MPADLGDGEHSIGATGTARRHLPSGPSRFAAHVSDSDPYPPRAPFRLRAAPAARAVSYPVRVLRPQRPGRLLARVAAAAFATALAGCASGAGDRLAGASTETSAPGATSQTGFDGGLLPVGGQPHEFTLTDQHGRRVSLSSFRGDVVILAFLYSTSKATAPLIAQQIRGAVDELEPHTSAVRAVAVSVDPTADTPARVRSFLRATSLTGRLEYLTGGTAQLRAVWRAYHVVPASAGEGAYERGAFVLLLDKAGAARVDFSLEELTPEGLAHDVRKLEAE
jgi:protein SCO1